MIRTLLAASVVALFAFPVMAQQPRCAERMEVINGLVYTYGEQIIDTVEMVHKGVEYVWAFWANPETQSWTITLYAEGTPHICMMVAGDDYHDMNFRAWVRRVTGRAEL